jgi:hypothetical protein
MKRLGLAIALAGVWMAPLGAQNAAPDDGGAPDVGVARISLINGDVSVRRGDTGEVVAAEVNAPLVDRDHLITAAGSRAEVQFDYANMIRVGPSSDIRMGELRDLDYLVQVAEGTATFRVLRDSSALVEISTPTVSVRPLQRGAYRILVRPDGSTQVTVRSGQAEIYTPRGTESLRAGQTMEVRGDAANPEFVVSAAIPSDQWDRWNELRDNDLERTRSYQYVSRDIYGADDLDGYGRWVYDPPYGWVWVPSVAAGWAPYRVGRWVNINYYGWTWLSADPWGWAPYHWGRWYWAPAYGWAWYPGVFGPRYYWQPALVTFFGWGSGFGFGFGFGNIGWCPLAPFEIYRPWYGPRVVNNIVVNNINIVNSYRNARIVNGRSGVTSVRADNFGRGRVNVDNYVNASARDLTRTAEIRGRMPIDASPESRRFSDRPADPVTVARASRTADTTQFISRAGRGRSRGESAPAAAAATAPSGDASRGGARSRAAGSESNGPPPSPNPRAAAAGAAAVNGQNGGWRRFDEPARADQPARSDAPVRSDRRGTINNAPAASSAPQSSAPANGWRRFDASPQPAPSTRSRGAAEAPAPAQVVRPQRSGGDMPSRVPRSEPRSEPQRSAPQRSAPEPQRAEPSRSAPERAPQQEAAPARSRGSRGDQQPVRISPPIVQDRSPDNFVTAPRSANPVRTAPVESFGARDRSFGSSGRTAPAEPFAAPSRPSGGGFVQAPRSVSPMRSAPVESFRSEPRSFAGGGAVRSSPRSGAFPSAPPISAPAVRSAPRATVPSGGGGGGFRSAPQVSAPRATMPGGGGGAPRINLGGGGGGGGGAVRSSGGGRVAGGGSRGRR